MGPHIEDGFDASPPFYISLNVHDKILHNCLMDSGASRNVMPKFVIDELGMDITKPYQDLYSFESKQVKCFGISKIYCGFFGIVTHEECSDRHRCG
jgi:hypothetical protein